MSVEAFFPESIRKALKNEPPGSWMPKLPEGCIRLSSGFPDPALVPAMELKGAVATLLDEEQDLPLHYLGSPRMANLKGHIQKRMAERGMSSSEDELLITAGACQAIDLISRILLDEKTVVVVEEPTYMEALEIFQNYTKQIISIPIDEQGLQTELLAEVLVERVKAGLELPKLLYTIPTFQNPTGTTMSVERRKQLLELSEKFDFLILEDDAYGELAFTQSIPTLKSFDQSGRILYVGSLSKIVAPGMRIGWVVGRKELITALEWFKKDLDHPFAQATMTAFLEKIDLNQRVGMLKSFYQAKCEVLIQALEKFLPAPASWFVPDGGYFVWVRIPGADTSKLLSEALAAGVSYVPGKYFFLDQDDGKEYLRLSFSFASEENIVKGVRKLRQLFNQKF